MLRMNLFELYFLSEQPSLWLCADYPFLYVHTAGNAYWAYLPSVISCNLTRWTGKMVNMYMNRSCFEMPLAHREYIPSSAFETTDERGGHIWQNVPS